MICCSFDEAKVQQVIFRKPQAILKIRLKVTDL